MLSMWPAFSLFNPAAHAHLFSMYDEDLISNFYSIPKRNNMSGDIHSGVQEVTLPNPNDPTRKFDDMTKEDDFEDILKPGHFSTLGALTNRNSNGELSLCCDICNIRVTSAKILQKHLEGKRHKSKVERKGKTFHCDLCDVTANSEIQLNIHISSFRHKSRVAREEYKEFTNMSSYSTSIYILLFCIFCIGLNLVILVKVAF